MAVAVLVAGLVQALYTSVVADVLKINQNSLRLFPGFKGQRVHHLFYVSGVVAFDGPTFATQKNPILHNTLDVTWLNKSDLISTDESAPPFFRNKNTLIDLAQWDAIEESELNKIKDLPQIFILLSKIPTTAHVDMLRIFDSLKIKFSLLFFESHNVLSEDVFSIVPSEFHPKLCFVYLPKQSPRDCLLSPAEVVERLELRAQQCFARSLDLNILSFGSADITDENTANFYSAPSKENYLSIVEKENYLYYASLKILRVSGLAGILGFLCWILKILFNPSAFNIGKEFQGWVFRCLGWFHGLFIDSIGLIKRSYGFFTLVIVRLFWFIKRNLGRSWEVRLFMQGLWGQRWRMNVFVQRKIGEAWRIKAFLFGLPGQAWRLKVFFIRLWSQRWRIRTLLQSIAGQSWRIRVLIVRLKGQGWRVRYFFQKIFWVTREVQGKFIVGLKSFLYSPLFSPFRKVYWFCKYQFETRILARKNSELDSE